MLGSRAPVNLDRHARMGVGVTLATVLLLSLVRSLRDTSPAPAAEEDTRVACVDSDGRRVDWWVVYKSAGSGSFVVVTSRDAADPDNTKLYGRGISDLRSLYASDTSPLIKTIDFNLAEDYALTSHGGVDKPIKLADIAAEDNRLFFAWNDEMPGGSVDVADSDGTKAEPQTDGETDAPSKESEEAETRGRSRTAGDNAPVADKDMPRSKSKTRGRSKSKGPTRTATGSRSKSRTGSKSPAATKKDQKRQARKAASDMHARTGKNRDMYGGTQDMRVAHSKGMLGMGLDHATSTVSFYVITHSIPGIPGFESWEADAPVKRRHLPSDLERIFEDRDMMGNTKGQHAMCLSLEQRVKLVNGLIQFDRKRIDHDKDNLFALLDGLDIIHPGMVATDYDPWAPRHRAYHMLFNVAPKWSAVRWTDDTAMKGANMPPGKSDAVVPSDHAFVLWPAAPPKKGRPKKDAKTKLVSRRMPRFFDRNRCASWDPSHVAGALTQSGLFNGRTLPNGHQCFLSISLNTTAVDGDALHMTVDFKHGLMPADLDDIIKRHLLSADERTAKTGSTLQEPATYAVVVQSWIDRGTQGPRRYVLPRADGRRAAAWFLNSTHVVLPLDADDAAGLVVPSSGRDHAKWFASFAYGTTGAHSAVAGVSDLNRNTKATRLSKAEYGRSGAVFATHDSRIVSFFYEVAGGVEDTARFASLDLGAAAVSHGEKRATAKYVSATRIGVTFPDGFVVDTRIPFFNVIEQPPLPILAALPPAKPERNIIPESDAQPKDKPKALPKNAASVQSTSAPKPVSGDKRGQVKAVEAGKAVTAQKKIPLKLKTAAPPVSSHSDEYYAGLLAAASDKIRNTPLPDPDGDTIVTLARQTAPVPAHRPNALRMVKQPAGAFTYRETRDGPVEVALDNLEL